MLDSRRQAIETRNENVYKERRIEIMSSEKQIIDSFMRDLVEWVLTETSLNPDKGVIQSARDFCEMHDVEYDAKTIEPLLFAALI